LSWISWQLYVTLTMSQDKTSHQGDVLLEQYLREVEEFIRAPLSCLIAPEQKYSGLGMPPGRAHFHLLVGSGAILESRAFVNIWRQPNYGGTWVSKHKGPNQKLESCESAYVLPYDTSIDASFYLFKTLGNSDWEWSLRRGHLISREEPESAAGSSKMRKVLARNLARRTSVPSQASVVLERSATSRRSRKNLSEPQLHALMRKAIGFDQVVVHNPASRSPSLACELMLPLIGS
jgi:hypothetical protein